MVQVCALISHRDIPTLSCYSHCTRRFLKSGETQADFEEKLRKDHPRPLVSAQIVDPPCPTCLTYQRILSSLLSSAHSHFCHVVQARWHTRHWGKWQHSGEPEPWNKGSPEIDSVKASWDRRIIVLLSHIESPIWPVSIDTLPDISAHSYGSIWVRIKTLALFCSPNGW